MELVRITDDEKRAIRRHYNKTDKEVENQLKELKQWMEDNNLKDEDEKFIEIVWLQNRYQIEKTKKKLSAYSQMILDNSDIFSNLGRLQPSTQPAVAFTLPNLTPKLERIIILKRLTDDLKFDEEFIAAITLGVILIHNNYCLAGRILVDFSHFHLHQLKLVNVAKMMKLMHITLNGFSARIAGFDIINAPSFLSMILNIGKLILKPKLYSRIKIHENLESLYETIPKHCLPRDYGGDLESIENLLVKYDSLIECQRPLFEDIETYIKKSDLKPINGNSQFGVEGSFKQLAID